MKKYRIKTVQTDLETTEYTPQKRIFFFWISYPIVFKKEDEAQEYLEFCIKKDKNEHITYTYYE